MARKPGSRGDTAATKGSVRSGSGRASRSPGMGRGLSAILSETRQASESGDLREVPIASVRANPNQPRKRFDPDALEALKHSVEASGIVQPLLVRPLPSGDFELIAGERRLRAAHEVGLEAVPVIVRDPAEEERLQQALIENMVREDLNPVEEARACEALVRELGLSKQDVSKRIGRSRPALSNLIRLLELPDEVLEMLEDGRLSEGHGRAILAIEDHGERRDLARRAIRDGWSVRRTEEAARDGDRPARPRQAKPGLSAEERSALREMADRFERILGHEVKIGPKGEELSVEFAVGDYDDLAALAKRLESR